MMRFSKRQKKLLLSAVFLSGVMMAAVPFVTNALGPLFGYLGVFALYWICFCIPVAIFFGEGEARVRFSLSANPVWIPAVAVALPVGVFLGADTLGWIGVEISMVTLAVGCALINGPLEELAWRRTFRANSGGRLSFELAGLFLFTLWHVPLYFSKGVSFDHGATGLIGGALMLGAIWTVLTRKSNSIGWPIVSHTLVNIAGFIPLFALNFAA